MGDQPDSVTRSVLGEQPAVSALEGILKLLKGTGDHNAVHGCNYVCVLAASEESSGTTPGCVVDAGKRKALNGDW